MEKRRKTRQAGDYLEYGGEEGLPADSMAEAVVASAIDLYQAVRNVKTANEKQEELLQDTAERYGLESSKELDALLRDEYKDKTSKEFLVNGAILTYTNSTKDEKPCNREMTRTVRAAEGTDMGGFKIEGLDTNQVYGKLTVNENGFSSDGLMHATVADSRPRINIPCFGNCDRCADSEEEWNALEEKYPDNGIAESLEETMGTCFCLRKLEERWENAYIPFGSYATFQNGETGEELAGITMTSILFCRHGGFIYPVTSGQEMVRKKEPITRVSQELIKLLKSYETRGRPKWRTPAGGRTGIAAISGKGRCTGSAYSRMGTCRG